MAFSMPAVVARLLSDSNFESRFSINDIYSSRWRHASNRRVAVVVESRQAASSTRRLQPAVVKADDDDPIAFYREHDDARLHTLMAAHDSC